MQAATDRISVLPVTSAGDAFGQIADTLTGVFVTQIVSLETDDSPEPVHKARVALRRFRAAITAFDPILDEDLSDALQDRARTLFRLLGTVRDADVMAARFATSSRAADLAEEAAHQRHKLRRHLKRKKATSLKEWVTKRLAGKSWRRTGKKAKALREASVSVLAAQALDRAWLRCESNGTDLLVMSARAQHDLRKDLKMLRYLCEFFEDIWPGPQHDAFVRALRHLQDDLGELTDDALAVSLGHDTDPDLTAPQDRAAKAWAALVSQGPWWQGRSERG